MEMKIEMKIDDISKQFIKIDRIQTFAFTFLSIVVRR